MSEIPQHWRFELGRSPKDCKVFLNGEQWFNVAWLKIEVGAEGMPTLTFQVYPHAVVVDINPSLQGDSADGLFSERRATGPTHQPL